MKVLAVSCCTGGEDLVQMTEACVDGLLESKPVNVELNVWVHAQDTTRVPSGINAGRSGDSHNKGFAHGMNTAIREGLLDSGDPDYVLCFNNDLVFTRKNWLKVLLGRATQYRVTLPGTDRTALHKQSGPVDKAPFDVQEASAYCWLVPFAWCKFLKKTYGWWLFDPQFFAFAEDNKTAFLLSKRFGTKAFRIVPRSFVHHMRHQTTSVVKPNRRESSRILKEFFQAELKDPKLRPDLRKWAERYVRALKT